MQSARGGGPSIMELLHGFTFAFQQSTHYEFGYWATQGPEISLFNWGNSPSKTGHLIFITPATEHGKKKKKCWLQKKTSAGISSAECTTWRFWRIDGKKKESTPVFVALLQKRTPAPFLCHIWQIGEQRHKFAMRFETHNFSASLVPPQKQI